MAVKIKSLERNNRTISSSPDYLYKDISLDLGQKKIYIPGYDKTIPGVDLAASFDLRAIVNSLQNLFNTLPGQRFLFPEYGLDLYQFLFEPITTTNAELIGNIMLGAIQTFEPRVKVEKIRVLTDPDNYQYDITLVISVPSLKITTNTDFVFNVKQQSIIFLPTTRNK